MANYLRPATDLKDLLLPGINSDIPQECRPICEETNTKGPARRSLISYLNSVPRGSARKKARGWRHAEELREALSAQDPEALMILADQIKEETGEEISIVDLLQFGAESSTNEVVTCQADDCQEPQSSTDFDSQEPAEHDSVEMFLDQDDHIQETPPFSSSAKAARTRLNPETFGEFEEDVRRDWKRQESHNHRPRSRRNERGNLMAQADEALEAMMLERTGRLESTTNEVRAMVEPLFIQDDLDR